MPDELMGKALIPIAEIIDTNNVEEFPLAAFLAYISSAQWEDFLSEIFLVDYIVSYDADNLVIEATLAFLGEIALELPGGSALALILASAEEGWTTIHANFVLGPDSGLYLDGATFGVRFGTEILADVETGKPAEIKLSGNIHFSSNGILIDFNNGGLQLAPAYVCGTEIRVEINDLIPIFKNKSSISSDLDANFYGIVFKEMGLIIPSEYLGMDNDLFLSLEDGAIGTTEIKGTLILEKGLFIHPPGVDSFGLVLGGGDSKSFKFHVDFCQNEPFRLCIENIEVVIRIDANVLRPLKPDTDTADFSIESLDIQLGIISIEISSNGEIYFNFNGIISIPPCMVGESGVIISAEDVIIRLSNDQELPLEAESIGLTPGWRGLYIGEASVSFPEGFSDIIPDDLTLSNCFIGQGGFSGAIDADWTPALSRKFFGMGFELNHFGIEFVQNSLVASDISGRIFLPFFDDFVDIEIGIDLGGSLSARLSSADGLYTLTKENILELELESLGFETTDTAGSIQLSGAVTPLFGQDGGLEWPSFDVKELSIDSQGNVKFDGGWLDLEQGYSLDLYGFQMEITKLGFGKSDDGGKWVGFSGGLTLVDGLTAGASVEGLRITWYEDVRDPQISLNGAGVELMIPETLYFKGVIAFRQFEKDGKQINRFDGGLVVSLLCLGLEIDGQVVFGVADNDPFMALYLGIELPAGIPLGNTGIALYGMAGLGALQMEPDKKTDEEWYSLDHKDWFHKGEPGVSDLTKWEYQSGAFAIGAGITLGTLADNGYTFSGKMLLVVVIPGAGHSARRPR